MTTEEKQKFNADDVQTIGEWPEIPKHALFHPVVPVIFAVASTMLCLYCTHDKKIDLLDPGYLPDILSFIVVVSLWLISLGNNWRNSLPKYLSVRFKYKENTVMKCLYAPLSDTGDIRQMAQSIGKEMIAHSPLLPIVPIIRTDDKETHEKAMIDKSRLINDGKPFLHYSVCIELTGLEAKKELMKFDVEGEDFPVTEYEATWASPSAPLTKDDIRKREKPLKYQPTTRSQ